jgi:hypothetical protein
MNRRALFARLGVIAAAAALAPAVQAEAAPSTGYGPNATWYLERNERGEWLIIDQASGDVYTGAPSDEMLDALATAMQPAPEGTFLPAGDVHLDSYWKGWDDGAHVPGVNFSPAVYARPPGYAAEVEPLTFEEQRADCAKRGCSTHQVECLDGAYIVIHGHPDIPPPWPTFGPFERFRGPLTPAGLASLDAWRRGVHDAR